MESAKSELDNGQDAGNPRLHFLLPHIFPLCAHAEQACGCVKGRGACTYQRKKAANGWNFCVVLPWKMLRRELTFPAASEIMNTLKAQATDGTWSTPHGSLL